MAKNKLQQHARRQVRIFVNKQFRIINRVIKKKPKYFPTMLWRFGARIFIDVDLLKEYMANGVESQDSYKQRKN